MEWEYNWTDELVSPTIVSSSCDPNPLSPGATAHD